ncbi:adenosine kinase [Halobacteriovorax sp. GB3]|uniref:adenosine kinase n=1 Tax=Halobacteriovorax sp. GB3 TaxID=2719615 RepID=UPI00235DC80C|nr:adenosine kinase [Halobacteriovorax sp. GB3]MDD0852817.1 adenosine kinase [Halobacteriovorax sp. GB3]
MSLYDVYGIGNALVDMEFEVTNDFLQKMNVEKGLMTLVEQERQSELLENLDGKQHKRSCGGSAANTMIAVSQLGGKAFYSCKVASDETGDFYYQDLVKEGVSSNINEQREKGTTGKCMVFVTPDADRTMNTYLGITATFSESELREEEIKKAKYLYMEGYLVTGPTGKAAAIKAKEIAKANNVKTALTFSDPGVVSFFKEGFNEMIGEGVDLLFCNEAEALSYTGTETIEQASVELKKIAKTFAITLGEKGAHVFDGQETIEVLTNKVEAVDTNGAGDLFAGAFLYGITNGLSYAQSARLACSLSSQLVTQFGARLKKSQVEQIKKETL